MGFYGVINGVVCNTAMEFVKEARRVTGEFVPDESLAMILNQMTDTELRQGLFTKKEVKLIERWRYEDKEKFYMLKV